MAKIKGNKKSNMLKGTTKIDEIDGLGGHDQLFGDKGDDALFGRAGNDILDGSVGDDVMKGGAGDDLFIANKGKDKFIGGKGIDTVSYAASKLGVVVSLLDGSGEAGALSDTYKKIENVEGTGFDDAIEGNAAANHLLGLAGNDLLEGGAGDDTIEGGDGDDTMNGAEGNDFLRAGNGKDAFVGGAGNDAVSYAGAKTGVYVDLTSGKGLLGADGDTYSGIENVDGGEDDDHLVGSGVANTLRGGKGSDFLAGGGGDDKLYGDDGDDAFVGGAGGDAFFGGVGPDMVFYYEENAGVVVNLATGKGGGAAAGDTYDSIEMVIGSAFGDTMIGDGEVNSFFAAEGGDKVAGGGGNDRIGGGGGGDTLDGGAGDDMLTPGEDGDADTVIGGSGTDWVVYLDASADITVDLKGGTGSGGAAGDTYSGVENVAGGSGDDMLRPAAGGMAYGAGGDDIVVDSTGTEVLRGGVGDDTLTDAFLGADDGLKDIFFLEFFGTPEAGFDTVAGFDQGTDLFWLSNSGERGFGGFPELAHNAEGSLLAGRVVNDNDMNGVGNATQNYAQLIFEKDTKFLWYDYDGKGGEDAVKIAQIPGLNSNLTTSDFKVVPEDPLDTLASGLLIV